MNNETAGRQKTAAARARRTRIKHDRWAKEMRAAGWLIGEPGDALPEHVRFALQNYEYRLRLDAGQSKRGVG